MLFKKKKVLLILLFLITKATSFMQYIRLASAAPAELSKAMFNKVICWVQANITPVQVSAPS